MMPTKVYIFVNITFHYQYNLLNILHSNILKVQSFYFNQKNILLYKQIKYIYMKRKTKKNKK